MLFGDVEQGRGIARYCDVVQRCSIVRQGKGLVLRGEAKV